MSENCGACKFFVKAPLEKNKGECREDSPRLTVIGTNAGPQFLGGWPPTQEKNWCGKFKQKITVQ